MTELFQQLLVEDADEELGWQERALCAQTDPESFFPEKGGSTREAKKVCLACEVRSECLEYALSNDERFGIWGGLSERERRRIEEGRRLKQATAPPRNTATAERLPAGISGAPGNPGNPGPSGPPDNRTSGPRPTRPTMARRLHPARRRRAIAVPAAAPPPPGHRPVRALGAIAVIRTVSVGPRPRRANAPTGRARTPMQPPG